MRIVGIDYGTVRIGVAISDENQIIGFPLFMLENGKTVIKTLAEKLSQYKISKIVIGYPLFLNGKESPNCLNVKKFAEAIEAELKLPIVLWDERLSTAQIEKTMKEANISRKKRVSKTDCATAALILQSYLDANGK